LHLRGEGLPLARTMLRATPSGPDGGVQKQGYINFYINFNLTQG